MSPLLELLDSPSMPLLGLLGSPSGPTRLPLLLMGPRDPILDKLAFRLTVLVELLLLDTMGLCKRRSMHLSGNKVCAKLFNLIKYRGCIKARPHNMTPSPSSHCIQHLAMGPLLLTLLT